MCLSVKSICFLERHYPGYLCNGEGFLLRYELNFLIVLTVRRASTLKDQEEVLPPEKVPPISIKQVYGWAPQPARHCRLNKRKISYPVGV
jgi:hypothetical protein